MTAVSALSLQVGPLAGTAFADGSLGDITNVITDIDDDGYAINVFGNLVSFGSAEFASSADGVAQGLILTCPEDAGVGCVIGGGIIVGSIVGGSVLHWVMGWGSSHTPPSSDTSQYGVVSGYGFGTPSFGSCPSTGGCTPAGAAAYYIDNVTYPSGHASHVTVQVYSGTGSGQKTAGVACGGTPGTTSCNVSYYGSPGKLTNMPSGLSSFDSACELDSTVSTGYGSNHHVVASWGANALADCGVAQGPGASGDTHTLTAHINCSDGSTQTATGTSFTDSATTPADIPIPSCPAGSVPTSASVTDGDTGTGKLPGGTIWTAPTNPDPPYDDCGPGGTYSPCTLRYQQTVVPLTTTVTSPTEKDLDWHDCASSGGVDCSTLDVSTKPSGKLQSDPDPDGTDNDWYRCMWGPDDVPLADCYDSGVTTTGTSTGGGTTTDEDNCFPSGWGALNPIEWVEDPVKCALDWAFVPSKASTTTLTESLSTLDARPPASVVIGAGTGLSAVYSGYTGGCTHFPDFSPAQNGEGELPCSPANAGGGWTIAYGVMQAALIIGTILAVWGMLLAGFGGSAAGGDDL